MVALNWFYCSILIEVKCRPFHDRYTKLSGFKYFRCISKHRNFYAPFFTVKCLGGNVVESKKISAKIFEIKQMMLFNSRISYKIKYTKIGNVLKFKFVSWPWLNAIKWEINVKLLPALFTLVIKHIFISILHVIKMSNILLPYENFIFNNNFQHRNKIINYSTKIFI